MSKYRHLVLDPPCGVDKGLNNCVCVCVCVCVCISTHANRIY